MEEQQMQAAAAGPSPVIMIVYLIVVVVMIVALWKVFTKAGKPGWAAIVPIYNLIVLVEISGKPMWWVIVYLVCGPIAAILIGGALAEKFGKSAVWGYVMLGLFPFIGFPMLAFTDARYSST